jgi:hypothetical protein
VDSDGSGDVSSDELTALLQKMNGQESVSEEDAAALFSQLDSDDDGSLSQAEFDAARPQNAGGMPPPPPAQASASTESDSDSTGTAAASGVGSRRRRGSTTTVYDELDTNEDGTVSLAERLAGAAEDAADAALNVVDQLKQSTELDPECPQRPVGHRPPCLPGRQRRTRRSPQHLQLYGLSSGFPLRRR